jgi:uncharacterized protein YndB with AHSA1/START domain
MSAVTKNETQIIVETDVPLVRIIREFDATPDRVYRAHVDRALFAKWIGPQRGTILIDVWDARSGGSYRYIDSRGDFEAAFNGTFPVMRENELIIQTFCWEGMPDVVALEKLVFEALLDGRTRLTSTSLVDSFEARDAFVASGMEEGIVGGYLALDALLAG